MRIRHMSSDTVSSRPMTEQIRSLDAHVLPAHESAALTGMLESDLLQRHAAAIQRDRLAWEQVQSQDDWEQFLAPRLEALRTSLGCFPAPPTELQTRSTGAVEGNGFRIENLLFESRPGVVVTSNLYRPLLHRDR